MNKGWEEVNKGSYKGSGNRRRGLGLQGNRGRETKGTESVAGIESQRKR